MRPRPRLQTRLLDAVLMLVQRIKPLARLINRIAINRLASTLPPRPNPLSTKDPYTSWTSLTDRTWSGRHLPPVAADAATPATTREGPPTVDAVAALFVREGEMVPCPKSTVLFTYFAQWFTDGFLRTDRSNESPGVLRDTRKNESNHEIDLMQLYGLNSAMTDQLRADDGRLKSQTIEGEEYPEFLYHEGVLKPEFDSLLPPFAADGLPPGQKNALFAMGSDTRNMGFMAFNVLFLREHNRIAGLLKQTYPGWSNDRVFETTRNILIVVLLKIVVEEYINHINPIPFKFALTSAPFTKEPWYRTNWMAIEFNLLYRWHPLVPSTFNLDGTNLTIAETLSNTHALTSAGLGRFMADASAQPAGRIGLFNTDSSLVDAADKPSIEQGRVARLRSYNDYRELCGQSRLKSFREVNSDPKIHAELSAVYDSVDDVEFYVGLFAEESGLNDVLPPLVMTMVAFDAFSQALTNPLVAPRIFNEATFSAAGMAILNEDQRISDLVHRNVPKPSKPYFVSLTRRGYRRV
jgi:prostaglandin-endoperoxide synthase 2